MDPSYSRPPRAAQVPAPVLSVPRSPHRSAGGGTGKPAVRPGRLKIVRWLSASAPVGTMAGPAVALFTVLLIIPLIMGIYYSFTDWTSFSSTVHFVGLANYRRVFNDSDGMMQALIVTGILSLACTVAINVLAVALAMLMNRRGRIYTYYRAAIFYPYVVSAIISGFLWNAILSPQGAAEHLLQSLGLSQEPFLTNGNWALGSVIAVTIWNSAGFSVVLYLAGLQTIPKDVVEAGEVDGAGPWQRFRHIIWPLLSPTVTINIVLILIGMFQTYALVLALTDGGPAGETETIGYQILAVGYANGELGYACAGAVVLLIGTCVLAAAVVVYRRRKEVSLA